VSREEISSVEIFGADPLTFLIVWGEESGCGFYLSSELHLGIQSGVHRQTHATMRRIAND
jgi:hypothetical protein